MNSFTDLPENLPRPEDDGACDHLIGMAAPDLALATTEGKDVNLSQIDGCVVVYCYPMTGRPGVALPDGWDDIPGARGCTPQSCAFRDHFAEITALGASAVFGMSTQSTGYQQEMAERLHLPFPVISDAGLDFAKALRLPMFEVDGMTLMKRVTLIIEDGVIASVHYPVFPSDADAEWVIAALSATAQ